MAPLILDIVLISIAAAVCINAYIQGFLISLFNILSSVAAMILSFLLYPVISLILEASPLFGWVKEPIFNSLVNTSQELGLKTAEELLSHMRLPTTVSGGIMMDVNASVTGSEGQVTIGHISEYVTKFIIEIIAIIVLFIVIKLLLLFAKKIVKGITKIPIVHQADKGLGLFLGLAEAFILLTIAGAVFALFSGSVDGAFLETVKDSTVGKFFYENNLLIALLI